jgi:hypothetical protein
MGLLNNVEINKPRSLTFPIVEDVILTSATSIQISCAGSNGVTYEFVGSGTIGKIEPGENKEFFANSDPITDTIRFVFEASSNIEVSYSTGIGSGGGGGGGTATDTNQVIIINILSGNTELIEFFEQTAGGVHLTDICQSMSIVFNGINGTLSGVVVPDGFVVSYAGTERNEIQQLNYTIPTVPDFNGFMRVLISYTKL